MPELPCTAVAYIVKSAGGSCSHVIHAASGIQIAKSSQVLVDGVYEACVEAGIVSLHRRGRGSQHLPCSSLLSVNSPGSPFLRIP